LFGGLKPNPHQLDYPNGRQKKSETTGHKEGNGGTKYRIAFKLTYKPLTDRSRLE